MLTPIQTAGGLATFEVPLSPPGRMSEDEFVAWCDEETRAEWVDGEILIMSPVNYEHDDLEGWLYSLLRSFVEHDDLGVVKGSEFMVRLPQQRRRRLPDVSFVAKDRTHIIQRTHVLGPPDLIVEIVSRDSQSRDWREKYLDYEAAGVREYWVIDPATEVAEFYSLADGKYRLIEPQAGVVHSTVLPGLTIKLDWLWPASRPKVMMALAELGVRNA